MGTTPGDSTVSRGRADELVARERMQRGDWVGAAAALRSSAAAYASAGAVHDAIRVCHQRIELQPNDVDGRLELARLYALRDEAPVADLDDLTAALAGDETIITGEPVEIVVEAIDRVAHVVPDGREIEGLDRGPADLFLGPDELPEIPLFQAFSPASRSALLQNIELVGYDAGATIAVGQEASVLRLVHRGHVAARRYDATGAAVHIARLRAGEFFGEYALLGGQRADTWYEAATDVQLFELPAAVLEVITEFHPGFADAIAEAFAHRMLNQLVEHAAVFGDLSVAERSAIARRFERISYRAGDYVLRRGDLNGRLFFVISGIFRVEGPQGSPVEVSPGHLLGFHSAVMNVPLDSDVRCVVDAMALVLPEDALSPLIAASRELVASVGSRSVSPRIVEVRGAGV